VIEIFIYPQAWPDHLIWAALLAPLTAYGPGRFPLGHLIHRRFGPA
jgi:putative oxidoreductase